MAKANFGIDAPGVIRNLLLVASAGLLLALLLPRLLSGSVRAVGFSQMGTTAFFREAGLHGVRRRLVNPLLMFPPACRVEAVR